MSLFSSVLLTILLSKLSINVNAQQASLTEDNIQWLENGANAAYIIGAKRNISTVCVNDFELILDSLKHGTNSEQWYDIISKEILVHTATACEAGWVSNGGRCYLFASVNLDFLTAQDYCLQSGANLIHINDAAENAYIKSVVKTYDAKSWWIGLRDLNVEGVFQWVDDDSNVTFTNWHVGQPNDFGNGEDCATLYKNYNFEWGDYYCTSQASHPICEKADAAGN